jgi:hypothetical protein
MVVLMITFTEIRIKRPVAGKTIIRVPNFGGLFSVEQLPQSEAWPALQFMMDQAFCSSTLFTSCSLLTIHAESV